MPTAKPTTKLSSERQELLEMSVVEYNALHAYVKRFVYVDMIEENRHIGKWCILTDLTSNAVSLDGAFVTLLGIRSAIIKIFSSDHKEILYENKVISATYPKYCAETTLQVNGYIEASMRADPRKSICTNGNAPDLSMSHISR